jgi:hypothetical protein
MARNKTILSLIPLLAVAFASGAAAQQSPMFPFVIPWDDSVPGGATDVSFLNGKPAGAHGRIVVKDGHFAESETGRRVRFLGVNLAAHSAFPSHEDAEKVAARLAKYGVNIVRLHHMDNDFWSADATLWDGAYKDHRHINPAQLDKLDYLIAQLKKNGVYANINLHVSRQFTAEDGFPASVEKIPTSFDKRVDFYDRRMIELQKEYAKQLLTHVNPYTHLSYAEDPCIAVVEINNENSLVGDPWATLGAGLDDLPEPFRGELAGLWNDWLQKKYGREDKLRAAWLQGVTPLGAGMLTGASPWSDEHQGTSQAAMTVSDTDQREHAATAHEAVNQIDGTDWHVQIHQTGLDFHAGDTYTVSFRAKADKPRAVAVAAALDEADWHNIGLAATANVGADWQTFRFTFEAHDTVPSHGRIAFTLGDQTGTVDIADLQVRPGAEGAGLQPGESLAAKTIGIPASATKAERADWLAFLADTERSYADGMRDYLKKDLRVHANVIGSQISWGGLAGPYREAGMAFADNHAYWQHPSFPHKPWDSVDWNIQNTPMVSDLAAGKGGTLRDLAEYRIAGKPYSVSEYNEPAPSDFQSEMVPELASYAAFQDWDIIYLFDYGSYGAGGDNDKIGGFFGVGSNPAKWAFVPAAALIFRNAGLGRATTTVIAGSGLGGWRDDFLHGQKTAGDAWKARGDQKNFLTSALALGQRSQTLSAWDSNASRIAVTPSDSGPRYVADGPGAISIAGFVGGQSFSVRAIRFEFPEFGDDSAPSARNFAGVTLTPFDGKPLDTSRHLLLTLAGRVENQDMHWNSDRTSVGDRWGHAPSVAEGIPATITLNNSLHRAYALDATGKRAREIAVTDGKLTVGPQYRTLWYEIGE